MHGIEINSTGRLKSLEGYFNREDNNEFKNRILLTGMYDFYECHHGRPSYKHRYSNESVFLYWCDSRDRWQVNEISLNT